ncbi:MAG: LysR substrate-binding domain-containing protein [Desulfovibrio sp.]|nr:LysR substrate-binding domain-containing protein [Desulfovibrio sp.]
MASYHAIVGGVIAGMGVGVVPESVLPLWRSDGTLSVHPLEHPLCKSTTELVWRKGVLSANMAALQECLRGGRRLAPIEWGALCAGECCALTTHCPPQKN